ncbi:sigma-70 factor domain-containing protein [Streptomyces sp. NPDC002573]|uniref:sigma-70 factor domain-containing protein n=1 Tax=Streptomyces sp. NPDC002573 TaxID=3364651 RepID=UPI003675FA23
MAEARRRPEPVEPGNASDLLGTNRFHPLLSAEDQVELVKRIDAGVYADHLLREAEASGWELSAERRRGL